MSIKKFVGQDIALPSPDFEVECMSVVDALRTRRSVKNYGFIELSLQELSNVCWATCGKGRDEEHITIPTAMNRQEIRLYVFTEYGAWEYLPQANSLAWKCGGDHRALFALHQEYVLSAPVTLLLCVDYEKFGACDERAKIMTLVDVGIASENINLYCHAVGIGTVPRINMDVARVREVLQLPEKVVPVLNNTLGFEKK